MSTRSTACHSRSQGQCSAVRPLLHRAAVCCMHATSMQHVACCEPCVEWHVVAHLSNGMLGVKLYDSLPILARRGSARNRPPDMALHSATRRTDLHCPAVEAKEYPHYLQYFLAQVALVHEHGCMRGLRWHGCRRSGQIPYDLGSQTSLHLTRHGGPFAFRGRARWTNLQRLWSRKSGGRTGRF